MKELTSKKTGEVYRISDSDFDNLVKLGVIGRYRVTDVSGQYRMPSRLADMPILKVVKPDLKLDIETKKVLKTKSK